MTGCEPSPVAEVPVLATALARLRPLQSADAPALQRHADDEAVWRTLFEGFPRPYTLADAEAWCGHGSRAPAMGHVWGIEVEGGIVGCIGVRPDALAQRCCAEVGYWIGQAHWGRGICSEALARVSAWAFEQDPELTRLYAPIYDWNLASMRVARKAGYVFEGHLPHSQIKAGRVIGRVLYARYRAGLVASTLVAIDPTPRIP